MRKIIRFLLVCILLFGAVGCAVSGNTSVVPMTGGASKNAVKDSGGGGDPARIEEDGSYDTAPEVALYLVTYHRLPGNYMTKKEAKALGWTSGSLEDYAPGKCIGGDVFGNREGVLPKGHKYHECDIETLGEELRGAKRLVYSEDFDVYYTKDHYRSFNQLY